VQQRINQKVLEVAPAVNQRTTKRREGTEKKMAAPSLAQEILQRGDRRISGHKRPKEKNYLGNPRLPVEKSQKTKKWWNRGERKRKATESGRRSVTGITWKGGG